MAAGFRNRVLRAATLSCSALFLLGANVPTPTVYQSVAALSEQLATQRNPWQPTRCDLGVESRPSFGCPIESLLQRTPSSSLGSQQTVSVAIPESLNQKDAIFVLTVDHGRLERDQTVSSQVVRGLKSSVTLELPPEFKIEASDATVLVHATELGPLKAEFLTRPGRISEGAQLSFGLGTSEFAATTGAGATTFRVIAEWDRNGHPRQREVFAETVGANAGGRWLQRRVDLSSLAGREVSLRFVSSTAPTVAGLRGSAAYPLWGSPQVLVPRRREGRRNVVLISLDTVRADFLGGRLNASR